MTDDETPDVTPPAGEPAPPAENPVVRIIDLSADDDAHDRVVEIVRGFASVEHANAFARAYVRDSVEICRAPDATADDVLAAWRAFGEDAEVAGGDEQPLAGAWRSEETIDTYVAEPAGAIERNWRTLDPRGGEVAIGGVDEGESDLDIDEDEVDEDLIPPTIIVDMPPRKPH